MRQPENHIRNETYVGRNGYFGDIQMYLPKKYQYRRPSEVLSGMEQIVEQLYKVTGEFFDVTEAEWSISEYGSEYPADSVIEELRENDDVEPPDVLTTTVTDGSVNADSAFAALRKLVEPLDGPWHPVEVNFDGRTKFYIDKQWQMVGADTPELFKAETASPHRDQRFEDPELIAEGPLGINIGRTSKLEGGWGLAYLIHIRLHTDIWNEDTTIGNVNRKQLEAFLARLYTEFNVAEIYCGERAQNSWVEDFVDPDLIS